MKKYTWTIHWP